MRLKALAGALLLSWAAAGVAQTPTPPPAPPQWRFELHGFVGGTLFAQDAPTGPSDGQHMLYVPAQTNAVRMPSTDKIVLGGDVRQSRFNFSVAGPKVFGGATPKGVLELDWFGGFGAGASGDVSLAPRLRLAYAELDYGAHRIQFGQNLDLSFAMSATSLSHIAQPLGFGTGNIGWRRPGIFGYHTFGDIKNKDATKVEFAWEVGRSQWNDAAAAFGGSTANPGVTGDKYGFTLGEASGLPAVQARLTLLVGQAFTAFAFGHWSQVDRNGVDQNGQTSANGISSDMQTIAGGGGLKLVLGPLTAAACGYTGKNVAPLVGAILQQYPPNFVQGSSTVVGDVHEYGYWGQLGFNLTKEFSVWGFYGQQKPNYNDAIAANFSRLKNRSFNGMLQYRDGGFAIGAEYMHIWTDTRNVESPRNGALDGTLEANQVSFTGMYFF